MIKTKENKKLNNKKGQRKSWPFNDCFYICQYEHTKKRTNKYVSSF